MRDDRQDLDELVPTGEPTRRLVAPSARVAVDGNREDIAHPPSVHARELVGRTAVRGRCSLGDAMPIRLADGVQRAGTRRSAVRGRDVAVKRTDDRSDDGRQENHLDQEGVRARRR